MDQPAKNYATVIPTVCSLPLMLRNEPASATLPLRILPLGDSITWIWGYQPDGTVIDTNGHRAPLLSSLVAAGYEVDFVGTLRSGDMPDNDNGGHSGFTISQIQNVMAGGLAMKPNVVLLHAGTNDLNRPETQEEPWLDAPERLGSLLDDALMASPDAVVIVAEIIEAADSETLERIKAFNSAIADVVKQRMLEGYKVTVVDQSVIGADELADGLHP